MQPGCRRTTFAGFNINIVFTGITSFLTDTSVKMIYSVMPMFLLSIGASKTSLALIEGIAESTASLVKVFSGYLSDRFGKNKPFMIAGYGLSALMIPIYTLVVTPAQVLLLRFAERFGKGIRAAPRDSLIAASIKNGDSGKSFGFQKAMDNSGAVAGPLLAFLLLSFFPGDYRLVFLLAGVPAIIAIFVIIFGIKEARKTQDTRIKKFRFQDLPTKYYYFLAIVFIFTLGNSTDALLLVKANETGVSVAFIPLAYLLMNMTSVIASIPAGSLSDRIGKEKVLIAGFLIYAAVYFGFGFSTRYYMILILFALYGVYSAFTDGVLKAFISDLVSPNLKGTGMGIYNALAGITVLPASLIGGLLYDKVNSNIPFYFGSGMAFLSAVLMFVYVRKFNNEGTSHDELKPKLHA